VILQHQCLLPTKPRLPDIGKQYPLPGGRMPWLTPSLVIEAVVFCAASFSNFGSGFLLYFGLLLWRVYFPA
jgi:hypothetical protein